MKFGLKDSELELLQRVFHRHGEIREVRIFGSRALGNSQSNSDIDLALWGEIDDRQLAAIAGELDELPLPYFVDTIVYDRIQHADLKRHIDEFGKALYGKE